MKDSRGRAAGRLNKSSNPIFNPIDSSKDSPNTGTASLVRLNSKASVDTGSVNAGGAVSAPLKKSSSEAPVIGQVAPSADAGEKRRGILGLRLNRDKKKEDSKKLRSSTHRPSSR